MTLRLILTRHAKSSWDDPLLSDHARPLNARGRRAADAIGGWLASRGDVPGEVLCSDAARTRETWDRIAPVLGDSPALRVTGTLYLAGPDVMLEVLRGATAPVVMMIGHNPGIAEFAARIASRFPSDVAFTGYPTGATMVATFGAESWSAVGWGTGSVLDFTVPRALER